jgi:FAD binding domain
MRIPIYTAVLLSVLTGSAAFVVPTTVQHQPAVADTVVTDVPVVVRQQSTLGHRSSLLMATAEESSVSTAEIDLLGLPARPGRPLKVIIAGGGVGGLTAALFMLKKGFDVTVCEKTSAFARFGGPIQFASNALSVLKEIDDRLFDRVMEKFTFTGIRTCGIKDGLRADGSFRMTDDSLDYLWNPAAPADWFVKFPLKECADLFGLRK